jgi:hypothetical protein
MVAVTVVQERLEREERRKRKIGHETHERQFVSPNSCSVGGFQVDDAGVRISRECFYLFQAEIQ